MLTDQLPSRFTHHSSKDWNLELSITGPKLAAKHSGAPRELNLYERIELLESHLRESGDLRDGRPQSLSDLGYPTGPRYFFEHTDAVKLIVPAPALAAAKGLSGLGLWISNPDFALGPSDRDYFRGSFLFLIEAHWDDLPFTHMMSGCSALQAVLNGISGTYLSTESASYSGLRDPITRNFTRGEPFGCGSHDHPIEKLQRIGAHASDRRRITSLYRLRYMTDEQCFSSSEGRDRFHDILGYPLYISDAQFDTPNVA